MRAAKRATLVLSLALAILVAIVGTALFVDPVTSLASRYWYGSEWLETHGRIVALVYALEDYRADHGAYPTEEEGIGALFQPIGQAAPRYFPEQYLSRTELAVDSWGLPIHYEVLNDRCVVYSLGRDGEPGGRRSDSDIRLPCSPKM